VRRKLEEELPTLALLRSKEEVLPREAPPSSTISSSSFPVPQDRAVMLLDNRSHIPGNPQRLLPTEKQLEKIAEKKRKANRKKHQKEKEKLKEAKRQKKQEESKEMEEDPKEGKND